MTYTLERRLCDDDGMVNHSPVAEPNVWPADLTYLRQINNLRSHTGHPPVAEPFHCTGHAHLAAEHIRCTSPAHQGRHGTAWYPAALVSSESSQQQALTTYGTVATTNAPSVPGGTE